MADNLWSSDDNNNEYYEHDGVSETILTTRATPSSSPYDITCDDNYIYIADLGTDLIYKINKLTGSVVDSINTPSYNITGITIDQNGNLITCDNGTKKLYLHAGFSETITDEISVPGTSPSLGVVGWLTWDGEHLYVWRDYTDLFYQLDGFSTTVLDSIVPPQGSYMFGETWTGDNLISVNRTYQRIYKHIGFTETIDFYISTPGSYPRGLTWDNYLARTGQSGGGAKKRFSNQFNPFNMAA